MPENETLRRARKALREGKAPSTAAGEFVREEMEHMYEGKHEVESREQAIAIGLSKARRAGIPLPPPPEDKASAETRAKIQQDIKTGAKKTGAKAKARRKAA